MESESSAKSLLSLFSSSKLASFTPTPERNFYKSSTEPTSVHRAAGDRDEIERPRKKRRHSKGSSEWTHAELCALETYRSLAKENEINDGLRDVLLPNRTASEIEAGLAKLDDSARARKGSKLHELEKQESDALIEEERIKAVERDKEVERAKSGLDSVLGLSRSSEQAKDIIAMKDNEKEKGEDIKVSLDHILGLSVESDTERRKRHLDETLGLTAGD